MMRYYILTLMIPFFSTAAFAGNCTATSALESYRNAEICGIGDYTPQVMVRATKLDDSQRDLLDKHFFKFRGVLENLGRDECPRKSTDETDLRKFINRKYQLCKESCKDKLQLSYNGCISVCELTLSAESMRLSGYLRGIADMTTIKCKGSGGSAGADAASTR